MAYSWFNGGFKPDAASAQAGSYRRELADIHLPWQLQDNAAARNSTPVCVQALSSVWTSTIFIVFMISMVCLHVCGNMPDRTFERWPRVRPAGSPFGFCFTSIFCLWYFMLETEVRLCSLCPGDLMCGIRHISPKLKQSSQMKFDHCCFTSRCVLIRVLLFYGECPHLISDSTEVLGLIPSQVFSVEFACSPHDSWIPLGSPVLGGQKNPPQLE